jgi:hypothetical protein
VPDGFETSAEEVQRGAVDASWSIPPMEEELTTIPATLGGLTGLGSKIVIIGYFSPELVKY